MQMFTELYLKQQKKRYTSNILNASDNDEFWKNILHNSTRDSGNDKTLMSNIHGKRLNKIIS